jgi:hypothetical protein
MLCQYNEQVARKQGKKKMKAPPIVEDNPDETIVDFDESVLVVVERCDNYGHLEQGVNLFGKCSLPTCKKKFAIKLGLGTFDIGSAKSELNKSFVPDLDLTHVDESVIAELPEESEKDTAAGSEKQLSE